MVVVDNAKKAVNALKDKVRNQVIRSPQELADKMEEAIDEHESKTGENFDEVRIYAETLPMIYQLYEGDQALSNHIQSAIRQSDGELGKQIKGLWNKFERGNSLNIRKEKEEELREIVAEDDDS